MYFSLFDKIKDSNFFKKNSNKPLRDFQLQLIVALAHLGLYRNGRSVHILGQLFGILGMFCSTLFFLIRSPFTFLCFL